MQVEPMSERMREKVEDATRWGAVKSWGIVVTELYVDQSPIYSSSLGCCLFATRTPYGVACVEAAFRDRMSSASGWDSKDQIRRDVLTNPHLHLSIKERLLEAFERNDWAGWHDELYCKRIHRVPVGTEAALEDAVARDPHLAEASRENLLDNLRLLAEERRTRGVVVHEAEVLSLDDRPPRLTVRDRTLQENVVVPADWYWHDGPYRFPLSGASVEVVYLGTAGRPDELRLLGVRRPPREARG
jgi:hypothetical protein